MEPKTKQSLLVTVVGVTLFVALLRLSDVLAFAAKLIDLVLPILAGGILALFINVPMTGLEKRLNRLFGKAKKQPSAKAIHLLSFFITLLGVVLVLVLALTLLIPELVQSFHSLYVQIEANIPRWTAYLNAQDADMGWLMNWLEGINWEQLLHKVTASIDTVLVNAVGAVSATVNIAITASFALIISVYMSLSTESLGHQARTLVCAYLKPAHAAGVLKFCRLFRQSFANFLTGQCSEAVILGVLMALAFSVFKIPYGSLVGVLTAICAIIPYVGALISCVVSVFLVLLVDPVLAVRCLIVYLAVQFVENPVHLSPCGGKIRGAFAAIHPYCRHDRRKAFWHHRHYLLYPPDSGGHRACKRGHLSASARKRAPAIKQRARNTIPPDTLPRCQGYFYAVQLQSTRLFALFHAKSFKKQLETLLLQ